MSFSRCLATFLVCCWCATPISTSPDSTEAKRVNAELMSPPYEPVLQVALIAASTGRHLFEMPRSISDDCVRTAKVALKLAGQPSRFEKSKSLIPDSVKTVQDSQSENSSEYAVELLCRSLSDQFRKNAAHFPDVEQLKKNVQLPKPAKNYYISIRPRVSVAQMMQSYMNEIDDPAFVKVISAEAFLTADTKVARVGAELAATSKAIKELARREAFKSTVDSAFEQLLDDYVKELYSHETDVMTKVDNDCYPYLKKMDAYFLQNTVLKEEYQKIKKEIIDKTSEPKKI